jgi:integrase
VPRKPLGHHKIYLGADGLYHCWPVVGTKPDGTVHRPHVKRKSAEEVADAVKELLARVTQGHGELAKIVTLAQWLDHWVHIILAARRDAGTLSQNGWDDYESICRVHLIPHLGQWRLTGIRRRLEPEHIETMYAMLAQAPYGPAGKGLAPSYIKRMHVTLNVAIKLAYKRGRADRNAMDLVDAPSAGRRAKKIWALPQRDAAAVLSAALRDPDAARWGLGIIAGPRQGEVLGILWNQVELDPPSGEVSHINLTEQIQRRTWQHGCKDPVACVRNRTTRRKGKVVPHNICKSNPCGKAYQHGCSDPCGRQSQHCPERVILPGCWRHRTKDGAAKACPPPCPLDCTGHASTCRDRKGGGLIRVALKTEASEEPIALGSVVTELLRRHREAQIRDGIYAEDGYVFPGKNGGPRDARRDYDAWLRLLGQAEVKHHRLHAARHTTGTFLKATGADLKEIQAILRHADMAMSGRYVDLALDAKRDALDRVAAALIDGDLSVILAGQGAKKVASHAL